MAEATTESIKQSLDTFDSRLEKFTGMCASLGTAKDNPGLRKRIESEKTGLLDLRDSIKGDVDDVRRKVVFQGDDSKTAFKAMAKEWGILLKSYERTRKDAERKLQEPVPAGKTRHIPEDEPAAESEDPHRGFGGEDIMQQLQPAYQMSHLHTEEDIQREKAEEIVQIAEDMHELNHMYKEFIDEVGVQGTEITVAQTNVEKARENIGEGTSQVQQASEYQKSSRKKMCCIGVLLLVIVIVIVIVVVVMS